ncbi:ABC transporter permease [Zavarzinella formosa]|uniref:ABC transporter permease n=1 Tax=Zavarzinella formosa TaxID=360055 RepID=UPI00030802E2|nr:ABC transporter permease [Zavarzinella formosa]
MMQRLQTIWQFRYFWMSLVQMDLRIRYRRSILGLGWSLLNPLLMTAIFCVVFSTWMPNTDWRVTAPYYLTGIAIWDFIKQAAVQGALTFVRNESYIRQSPLPLAVYCLRTSLGTTVHFGIAVAVIITTAVALDPVDPYHLTSLKALWVVLLGLALLFIFCVAFGAICAFMNIYFHDTQHLAEVGFSIAFFITPILYKKEMLEERGVGWLAEINPAVVFFDIIREPLLTGIVPAPLVFAKAFAATLIMLGVAVSTFSKCERTLIFHL